MIKVGYRSDMTVDDAIDLACQRLWEAADADSATGGPDALRGIYPIVATVTADGWERVGDDELASRYEAIADEVPLPMSMPFYVAPEQVMKDRADYARKGIARGRALVALRYTDGIAIVAENPSETLRKISEIYDRIAFAGVGKYNEFDQLRVAGVRAADLKGFQYSRDDVDARSLANQYAQILGQIFTHEMKPMEVEILVAEVGQVPAGDQMFHILYDGTVMDERDHSVLGGDAEAIDARLAESYADGLDLAAAVRLGISALAGPDRTIPTSPSSRSRRCRVATVGVASAVSTTTKSTRSSAAERAGRGRHRSQQRSRRVVRYVDARRRRRDVAPRHQCQRGVRVPRRRSLDAATGVRVGGRERSTRSAPRCRIPTSPASGGASWTSTRPNSATWCSTNSARSTGSHRSPVRVWRT